MSVVTRLLCLCLFIYALFDRFWENEHSHPSSLSNYMLTQTADRAIEGSKCEHFSAWTWPRRPAAIKAERQNGEGKSAAACWCRTACFWGSQKLLICFHTQPSLWFLKGMVQIRENQVLHKTPPTLRRMSYCDSRLRPHRLPLSAVHAQETEAAICTRPPRKHEQKCCQFWKASIWPSVFRWLGSEFGVHNMKVWSHPVSLQVVVVQ